MKKHLRFVIIIFVVNVLLFVTLNGQMKNLHGTDSEFKRGLHAGNQFRVSFFNDGTYGAVGNSYQAGIYIGEWPINSSHYYLCDGNIFVGAEVEIDGSTIHIFSENKSANIGGSMGDKRPDGSWRTFLPLPGFSKPGGTRIAMAKGSNEWPDSWPPYWPDIKDTTNPYKIYSVDGWAGSWNGYFGRDVFNADEESYFVADDYQNDEFPFYPDSTNLNRRGLGMRIYVRGFQWSKAAVEDGIFCLYDIHNIGTTNYDKVVFGYKIGNNMGEVSASQQDYTDDCAAFNKEMDFAYMWDYDNIGGGGYTPVGYMGGAFLESPGNPYDGIDNDNDSKRTIGYTNLATTSGFKNFVLGTGKDISESMFNRGTLQANTDIILIDYNDPKFRRVKTTLLDTLGKLGKDPYKDSLLIVCGKRSFYFKVGTLLREDGSNLFDDNLNGLIDENRGFRDQAGIWHYLYIDNGVGYKCIDFFSPDSNTNGMKNPLIDEGRDDGIDNDGDWKISEDDLGSDGLGPNDLKYRGPDNGESDGVPTPGEPHFDKTDIDETDMLGLTSFYLYQWLNCPGGGCQQADDEWLWKNLTPGFFSNPMENVNVELLYGSGYFPLRSNQVERISMAIICGEDYDDLIRNKGYFALAYNQNYNFSKAPLIPNVRAVVGNRSVKLFWDDVAESSVDPISGRDFEGYKVYRSTDPGWNDAKPITDAYGNVVFRKPIAQFDLDNGIRGLSPVPTQGVHFYLGEDTGLRHYWEDTTVVNGFTYYYAVTSYDRGDPALGVDPAECSKYVALSASGEVEKGPNVVIVRPEAPVAGYLPADFEGSRINKEPGSTADGTIQYEIVDPTAIRHNHKFVITFKDTVPFGLTNMTKSFTLVDRGTEMEPMNDTILANSPLLSANDEQLFLVSKVGFKLKFLNNPERLEINLNAEKVGWSKEGIRDYRFGPYISLYPSHQPYKLVPSGNYRIIFGDVGIDTSKTFPKWITYTRRRWLPERPVNFTVINTMTNEKVKFAFYDVDSLGDRYCKFSYRRSGASFFSDEIILLNPENDTIPSWWIRYVVTDVDTLIAGPGDELNLPLLHPFLPNDVFTFTTLSGRTDNELAKSQLDNIKVVPNPYIVTNAWEPKNPYTSGRGPRELHFIHLPKNCTIKIFNIRGQLVNTLYHNSGAENGTVIWNMLTKDNLDIAYGIYFYHVEAPGVGEKLGKFVVIK